MHVCFQPSIVVNVLRYDEEGYDEQQEKMGRFTDAAPGIVGCGHAITSLELVLLEVGSQ